MTSSLVYSTEKPDFFVLSERHVSHFPKRERPADGIHLEDLKTCRRLRTLKEIVNQLETSGEIPADSQLLPRLMTDIEERIREGEIWSLKKFGYALPPHEEYVLLYDMAMHARVRGTPIRLYAVGWKEDGSKLVYRRVPHV